MNTLLDRLKAIQAEVSAPDFEPDHIGDGIRGASLMDELPDIIDRLERLEKLRGFVDLAAQDAHVGNVQDAARFIEWYQRAKAFTPWDTTRYEAAFALLTIEGVPIPEPATEVPTRE